MKTASEGFVAALNQPIRPTTQFRAEIGVNDSELEAGVTLDAQSGVAQFSTGVFENAHECDYITFEPDFFQVGSDQRIVPSVGGRDACLKNGLVSMGVTNNAGDNTRVIMSIFFDKPREIGTLTFRFAESYAKTIDIVGYMGNERVFHQTFKPASLESSVSIPENEIDSIDLRITGTSKPYRRIRLTRMWVGYHAVFETSDIISVDHTMQIDPVSASLPSHHLRMQVTNLDKRFNPDNPSGVWQHLASRQPVKIQYGTEVNGETEWLDVDTLYLLDAPTVDENSATFEAYDRLYFLTETYRKGLYRDEGYTLHELAEDVLKDAGVFEYRLDPILKFVYSYSPLPLLSHRECLQLIANAGCCVLRTDAQGVIVIESEDHLNPAVEDYYLDFTKALNKPLVTRADALKSVNVGIHWHYPSIEAGSRSEYGSYGSVLDGSSQGCPVAYESSETTYKAADKLSLRVEYPLAVPMGYNADYHILAHSIVELFAKKTSATQSSPGDYFAVTRAELYSRYAEIDIERTHEGGPAAFGVRINGVGVTDEKHVMSYPVGLTGEVCELDNPVITSEHYGLGVAEWMAQWLTKRNRYEMNFRQDFRLEPNDVITFQTQFEENIPVRITKLQFKLPGQSGAISVRRLT